MRAISLRAKKQLGGIQSKAMFSNPVRPGQTNLDLAPNRRVKWVWPLVLLLKHWSKTKTRTRGLWALLNSLCLFFRAIESWYYLQMLFPETGFSATSDAFFIFNNGGKKHTCGGLIWAGHFQELVLVGPGMSVLCPHQHPFTIVIPIHSGWPHLLQYFHMLIN